MNLELFVQNHVLAVLLTLVSLVALYGFACWFVPVARKAWDPKDGSIGDAVLDLSEAFIVYAPKVASAIAKLSGRYVPILAAASEVYDEIQGTRVKVAVEVTTPVAPDPHVAPLGPDDVVTADLADAVRALDNTTLTLEPPVSQPPRGAS